MAVVDLDIFIQDFVTTNKLMNHHCAWTTLANRSFHDDGVRKVFSFESGGKTHFAIGEHLALPDADWFRIELNHVLPEGVEHRFDYLRMMRADTHVDLSVDVRNDVVLVRLTTRHRGLINIVFVIRNGIALTDPFLV